MWFDGIIEGPRTDDAAIRGAVDALGALELAEVHLQLDGGRYSILMGDETVVRRGQNLARRADIVGVLTALVEATASRGPVESTLRATEVFEGTAVETLFAVQGRGIRALSRPRPATEADRARISRVDARGGASSWGWKTVGAFSLAAIAAVVVLGVPAKLFGPAPDSLVVDVGVGQGVLSAAVDGRLGDYVLSLRRGPGYPQTRQGWAPLLEAEGSNAGYAQLRAIAEGDDVFVTLLDEEGQVLEAAKVGLGPLLLGGDRVIAVPLGARFGAHTIRVGLDGR